MECNKWQDLGLLFISGEADSKEQKEFQEHMLVCAECRKETDEYYYDKKNFLSTALLSESPSKIIDEKIIATCSQKPIISWGINIFSTLWMKKALVPALFLVFGMGAGVYFTTNYFSIKDSDTALTKVNKTSPNPNQVTQVASKPAGDTTVKNIKDSTKNSEPALFSSQPKSQQNIIPVDLKKE